LKCLPGLPEETGPIVSKKDEKLHRFQQVTLKKNGGRSVTASSLMVIIGICSESNVKPGIFLITG
jgi:hypothetical protein